MHNDQRITNKYPKIESPPDEHRFIAYNVDQETNNMLRKPAPKPNSISITQN